MDPLLELLKDLFVKASLPEANNTLRLKRGKPADERPLKCPFKKNKNFPKYFHNANRKYFCPLLKLIRLDLSWLGTHVIV